MTAQTTPVVDVPDRVDDGAGLLLTDLLNDFVTLVRLLLHEVEAQHLLDAFLLAAGVNQVLEDWLHRDTLSLLRAASYLSGRPGQATRLLAGGSRGVGTAVAAARRASGRHRKLADAQRRLTAYLEELAVAVLGPASARLGSPPPGLARWAAGAVPPGLAEQVLRLPSCFRSFDLHPADVRRLVAKFAQRWPDRQQQPVLVVGVRSSGSYLAPLATAALRELGYPTELHLTVRPGVPLEPVAAARLRRHASVGGLVLLVDDPPASGSSVRRAAGLLSAAGIADDRIVELLPLFTGPDGLPEALERYPHVLLPGSDWSIYSRLAPEAVAATLAAMLPAGAVEPGIEVLQPATPTPRGHVRVRFAARVHGQRRLLVAEGAGLGYLGRHAVAVARRIPDLVPRVHGVRDGVLIRDSAANRAEATPESITAVASYVALRGTALATGRDRSLALAGRQPVWEVAGEVLGRTLGRLEMPLLLPVVDPLVRDLLRVEAPSVVDGRMRGRSWLGDGGQPRKRDFAEGAFSNRDLSCYDPVFDLAGAAASLDDPQDADRLRVEYARLTGHPVDPARWLVYRLVHAWDAHRQGAAPPDLTARAGARAAQQFFAETFLPDVTGPAPDGPYCAIDLDGVLESGALGFSTTTAEGALAMRALHRHGYRPLVNTGRSLDEVRDRCRAYRLAGGVAEYGAVLYDARADEVIELLTEPERAALGRVRDALAAVPGCAVEAGFTRSVRAFRDERGRRGPVPAQQVAAALAAGGDPQAFRVVPGDGQTDITVARCDKGTGLQALLARLGPGRLALAVGDTASDLPMLALAERAIAPGHAGPAVRASGAEVVRPQYQAGLAAAVGAMLGHEAGGCPVCRPPAHDAASTRLLALLAVQEAGLRGMPSRLIRLTWLARSA